MYLMTKVNYEISLILILNIVNVLCDEYESTGMQNNEKYMQIFENLPHLFEHILDALERKPEILESDDELLSLRSIKTDCDKSSSECTNIIHERAANVYDKADLHLVSESAGELWAPGRLDEMMIQKYIDNAFGDKMDALRLRKNYVSNEKKIVNDDGGKSKREVELNIFRLTPEEVEEQILKADQMLEQHNNSIKNKK